MLGHLILGHEERCIVSKDAAVEKTFSRLGLTDAALLVVAREHGSLLSADNDLYLAASTEGIEASNFAHPKPMAEQGKNRVSESRQNRKWESEGIQ
jgi:hypothetical protein